MRARAPSLLLVTPYLADANNGNWRAAARWARLLAPDYRVILQAASQAVRAPRSVNAVAMLALHARRSHDAIAAWRDAHPRRALVVALSGTDLYEDYPSGNRDAAHSMTLADRLVVLQGDAPRHLPADLSAKARVVFQSARTLKPWTGKRDDRLHCLLVAHLREVKDPATLFAAWRALPADLDATLTIVGAALEPALGRAARDLAAHDRRVQWLGPREHTWTRQAIKRAHVLIVPSRSEGGANVIVEAISSGTAVIGSRMSGNVGMLGDDHPGYFSVGDAQALAVLIERASVDRAFLHALEASGRTRAPLFAPATEARALRSVIAEALALSHDRMSA